MLLWMPRTYYHKYYTKPADRAKRSIFFKGDIEL